MLTVSFFYILISWFSAFIILIYIFKSYLDLRLHAAPKLHKWSSKSRDFCLDIGFGLSFYFLETGVIFRFPIADYICTKNYWNLVLIVNFFLIVHFQPLKLFSCLMQRSGYLLLFMALDAENEILCTLTFIANVMFWSQRCAYKFFLTYSRIYQITASLCQ